MKKLKTLLGMAMVVLLSMAVLAGCASFQPDSKIQRYTLDSDEVKVGIISDTQLPSTPDERGYHYEQNLYNAMSVLKERGMDALMFAGDFTDYGSVYAFQSYNRVYNNVFELWKEDAKSPVNLYVMGNHDYWAPKGEAGSPAKMQKRFKKIIGESPWSHKVINGYHFIQCSAVNGTYWESHKKTLKWLEQQIEIAIEEDPAKPVIVLTHYNPKDTVYGSDDWGTYYIDELFAKYPQVVSFSGHSHYSLLDERSIDQTKGFTAVQTQSLSYTELEQGKEGGSIPAEWEENPMGMMMTIKNNVVSLERISFSDDKMGETVKDPWVIDFNLPKETRFAYTAARAESIAAPVFAAGAVVKQNADDAREIYFDAASHADFVHSYEVIVKDAAGNVVVIDETHGKQTVQKSAFLYFSDYSGGLWKMADIVTLKLNETLVAKLTKQQDYTVEVRAIESFGKKSAPISGTIRVG